MAMPNDNHYGSEFQYMIHIKETFVGPEPEECSSIIPNFGMSDDDGYAEKYRKDFDDGVS